MIPSRRHLLRDFHAGQYFDLFLAAAVSSVLLIRLYLHVAGYPQIGGATLHVAHMLWGGLLMLAAIVLMLAYLGRGVRQFGAFLGGVGFGTFIDEVGKFVTQDNDYFYQPAIALIYIMFILLYVVARSIHREQIATPQDYLVNALQEMENVAVNDLDERERDRALSYLARSDPDDPLVAALKEVLARVPLVPVPNPHPLTRLRNAAVRGYRRLTERSWFARGLVWFFVVQLMLKLVHLLVLLFRPDWREPLAPVFPMLRRAAEGFGFVDWAQLVSAALAGAFVLLGVVLITRSRLAALRMFHRSILVSIFLTQVFVFYRDQWAALPILMFNLLVLAALHFAIDQETARADALLSAPA
jgi:hypothetical protein